MTNQDLAKKLQTLKNVAPSRKWLEGNRDLLLAQISNSGASDLPVWRAALINFSSFTQAVARPASAFAAFIVLLAAVGIYSDRFFAQAKPNDSLYIARIISEQVRLNTTFNSEARDILAVRYASDHAKDITTVLADPEFNKEENQAKVEKLNNIFKEEVETVRHSLGRLSAAKKVGETQKPEAPVEAESLVVIAEGERDDQGIQVLEAELPAVGPSLIDNSSSTELSASSSSVLPVLSEESELPVAGFEAEKILEEAKQLFDAKDYNKVSDKLKEVDEIIKQ